jgi:uncharacterized protein
MSRKIIFALLSGMLFAAGLVVSGMTQPAKVIAFLNVGGLFDSSRFGVWDPSLMFVMGGALVVTFIAFRVTPRAGKAPWAATQFRLPTRNDVDTKLVLGAALFGIGWGIAGYCPGPAFASILTGGADALTFTLFLVLGMLAAKWWMREVPA